MRKIKFRAWDKKKKEMTYFDLFSNIYLPKDKERLELMQFTGLLDKNEKEIYEGDILEEVKGVIEIVKGFDFGFGWKQNLNYKEIIGNAYENTELVQQDTGEV